MRPGSPTRRSDLLKQQRTELENRARGERRLVPLPVTPEEFLPTDEEIRVAHALQQEFISNQDKLDALLERQAEILVTLYRNPRLLRTLNYETIYEFLNDPEVVAAIPMKVGSRSQFYRMLDLALVHERFPHLHILREPELAKLARPPIISQLRNLGPGDEARAAAIIAQTRRATLAELNALPLPEVSTKGNVVLIDGVEVLRVMRWSPLAIRAVSKLAHFSPAPSYDIRDGKLVAWHNDQLETIGELTSDERGVEYVRDRLQAKQT